VRDFTCVDVGQGAYLSFLSQSAFFFRKALQSLECSELIQEYPKTTYRGFKPVPFKMGFKTPGAEKPFLRSSSGDAHNARRMKG
jgi:hypothetical protein